MLNARRTRHLVYLRNHPREGMTAQSVCKRRDCVELHELVLYLRVHTLYWMSKALQSRVFDIWTSIVVSNTPSCAMDTVNQSNNSSICFFFSAANASCSADCSALILFSSSLPFLLLPLSLNFSIPVFRLWMRSKSSLCSFTFSS